jgi:hypothetical protein
VLTECLERSGELATVRERHARAAARPAPGETIRDWVGRTFSLTFEYSWPDDGSESP